MFIIRTDASSRIGSGHVIRCLGLADQLRTRGHAARFVCARHEGNLIQLIGERGYECHGIAGELSPEDDAKAILDAADGKASAFIVDHYGLDYRMEQILRKFAPVMVIDDLADRKHDCDLLLDATHEADAASVYDGLVAPDTRRLIGLDYLMLRPEFHRFHNRRRDFGDVRRILVAFGGNDPANLTGRTLDALENMKPDFHTDILTGTSNPRREEILSRSKNVDFSVKLHIQHPEPSLLMAEADIALGAAGMTIWENCYLGLPSLVVKLADNQNNSLEILKQHEAAFIMGSHETVTADDIQNALQNLICHPEERKKLSENGKKLINGQGLHKVAMELEHLCSETRGTE